MDVELDTLLDALNRDRQNGVPDINRLSESMETEVVVSP